MIKYLWPLLLVSVALGQDQGVIPDKTNPGSLTNSNSGNPFMDRVARRVGDIVTIVIQEETVSNFTASTNAAKTDSSNINANFFNDFLNRILRPVSTAASSSVGGNGRTNQSSNMSARMSVVVREVLPNGNLVLEGTRSLVTNRETQTIVLSGIVRPFDIKPDNTVLSTAIADAQIRMEGQGMIADRQRRGFLTQILDWLF